MRWLTVLLMMLWPLPSLMAAEGEVNLPPEVTQAVEEPPPLPVTEPLPPLLFEGRQLTIAYLRGSDEMPLSPAGFQALVRSLNEDVMVRAAMRAAGWEESSAPIVLMGIDWHEDLRRRMAGNEFDMVFAPALIHALQTGNYDIVGQVRTSDMLGTVDRDGLQQFPVIFVNRESPLFDLSEFGPDSLTAEQRAAVGAQVASSRIAFVSASSAAGYLSPLLALHQRCDLQDDPPVLWCDTAEEVVMAVINNLVTIGACDDATFNRVVGECSMEVDEEGHLVQSFDPAALIRVIARPDWVPVAPVVMRSDLRRTELGQALVAALESFLEAQDPPLDLETPRGGRPERPFERLRARVEQFYQERSR
ncbi:PhnD/SsuA/transferrin family substrate-binding protein [Candidatus Sumerlaeota bacterium]|nr:PhnD/SsuA/transferrin family substrate-binding protein [Candidatus Sumerlaeota bacterium]